MVIYTREKKTLIIPEGLQCGSADCSEEMAIAYSSGITAGYRQGYDVGYEKGQQDCPECSGGTDCSSAITEAYQSGITEGINTQKSRMESITITANTAVTRTDGWNEITVNVPSESGDCSEEIAEAYQSGYTAGVDNQRGRLVSTAITSNGLYERTDGFSSINVQVPTTTPCNIQDTKSINLDDYSPSFQTTVTPDAGYAGLQAVNVNGADIYSRAVGDVQNQFVTLSATTNGLYTPSSTFAVFKEVYVNVPSSGDCSQAIEEAYQSGCTYAFDAAAERGFTFSTSGVITVSEDIVINVDDYDFLLDTDTNDFKFIDRVPMSFPSQSGFTYLLKAGNHTYDVKNIISYQPENYGMPPGIYVMPKPSASYHNLTVQSFGNGVVTPQSQEFYLELRGSH